MSNVRETGAKMQAPVGVLLFILQCVLGWALNCGVEGIFMKARMRRTGDNVGMLGVASAWLDGAGADGTVTDSGLYSKGHHDLHGLSVSP
jgi:hypothetical protein